MRKGAEGFTLIELAIVLVIIGLIVGGVLVGQDLIRAAEIRATISQIEKYNTAVNTFLGKYNCLPGDCENAEALLTRGDGYVSDAVWVVNGNGNGELEMAWDDFSYGANTGGSSEVSQLFLQLEVANLVPGMWGPGISGMVGANTLFPPIPISTGSGIMGFWFNDANYWYVGVSASAACNSTTTAGCLTDSTFTPAQAYAIDSKIDDGNPTTGRAQAYWGVTHSDQLATPGFGQSPGAALCASTSSTYNLAGSYAAQPLCQMMIQWQ